jgi:hypothetical protein
MPHKPNAIKERIKEFHLACTHADPVKVQATVKKALKDRNCLMVKQAAERCEERLIYDLEADLLKAYQRFLKNPVKNDPNCTAKCAIARALVALDSQDVDFFIAGLGYHQYEPVWGGSEDTAIDLRVSCAMGLVNTSYHRALIEIVALLHDHNPHVRKGAVRAIALTQPLAAEAVLRSKAIAGDSEPDVTGEVLSALLKISPHASQAFVSSFLDSPGDPNLRQAVAVALGASRLDEALEILHSCWNNEPFKRKQDNALLLGAILHRSENAFAWLLEVIAEGDRASARFVIAELAIYRTDKKLSERIKAALAERDDDDLTALYSEIWC